MLKSVLWFNKVSELHVTRMLVMLVMLGWSHWDIIVHILYTFSRTVVATVSQSSLFMNRKGTLVCLVALLNLIDLTIRCGRQHALLSHDTRNDDGLINNRNCKQQRILQISKLSWRISTFKSKGIL
jgi:hypothetical protein